MNSKPTHPLTASFLTNQFKNTTSCPDTHNDLSSQPISSDSPSQKYCFESRSDSLKTNKSRRTPSMKLAFLLDAHSDKTKKSPLFPNASKNLSSAASVSPQDREIKSTRASESMNIAFPSKAHLLKDIKKPKDGAKIRKRSSSKDISDKENIFRQKKSYLSNQFDETENIDKLTEPMAMSFAKGETTEPRKILGMSDAHNKETLRLRKLRKSQNSFACPAGRQNLSQQYPLTFMSCNFSVSPDNSTFNGGTITTMNKAKNETNGQSEDHLAPFSSPKNSFFNTIASDKGSHTKTRSRERGRNKKNFSIGEAITRDLQQKAYCNYQPSPKKGQQGHRKVGSTGAARSSIVGKSFSKAESVYSMNIPPCFSIGNTPKNQQLTDKSRSQDSKVNQKLGLGERSQSKKKVDPNIDHLNTLKNSFGSLISNYGAQIVDAQANQKVLIKIKQDYDTMVDTLIQKKQKMQKKLDLTQDNEENRSGNENNGAMKENAVLRQEVSDLQLEVQRLNGIIKDLKSQPKSSPCKSIATTEKRCPSDIHDSPPLTKHGKDARNQENEIDQLKAIIMKQQASLNSKKKKEAKMMRLIYAIKKEGVDIEKIYDEQVKGKFDHLAQEETIPTLNKAKRPDGAREEAAEKGEHADALPREEEHQEVSGDELGKYNYR